MAGGTGGRGAARTSAGSLVALAVAAVALVAAAVVWTGAADDASRSSTGSGKAPAPAKAAEARSEVRHWVDGTGRWSVSTEDACALLSPAEVTEVFDLPEPARAEQQDREWGAWCSFVSESQTVVSYMVTGGRGLPPREAVLDSFAAGFDIRHPDECPVLAALVDDGCYRVAAVPRLGDEAWTVSSMSDRAQQRPWAIDALEFRRGGHRVSFYGLNPQLPDDGPAQTLELARLLDSRLPDDGTEVPPPCPDSPTGC